MKNFKIIGAILLLVLAVQFSGAQQKTAEVEEKNGLTTVTFETKKGKVTVNLPSKTHAGDVISGTVIAEPKGKNQHQIQKNKNVLNGYVIEMSDAQAPINDNKFTWKIPDVLEQGMRMLCLKSERGELLAQIPVSINDRSRFSGFTLPLNETDFRIPDYFRGGETEMIPGMFDGDCANSTILLNGERAEILAESPEGIFVKTPETVHGLVSVQLMEGNFEMTAESHVLDLMLSADRLNLMKGERATISIEVHGMEGLERAVPMHIVNLTPGNIDMEGGDQQDIFIGPEELGDDGIYRKETMVTASQGGGFSVMVDVEPLQMGFVKLAENSGDEVLPERLTWNTYGLPDDARFDVKLFNAGDLSGDMDFDNVAPKLHLKDLAEPMADLERGAWFDPEKDWIALVTAIMPDGGVNEPGMPEYYYSESSDRCRCGRGYAGKVYADVVDAAGNVVTYVELNRNPYRMYLPEKQLKLNFKGAVLDCGKCGGTECSVTGVTYEPAQPTFTPGGTTQTLRVRVSWNCIESGCQSAACSYVYKLKYKRAPAMCTCGDVKVTASVRNANASNPANQGSGGEITHHSHAKSLGQQRLDFSNLIDYGNGAEIEVRLSGLQAKCWCQTGNCETLANASGDVEANRPVSINWGENDPAASNDNHNLVRVNRAGNGWQANGDYVATLKIRNQNTNERNVFQDFVIQYKCNKDDCRKKYCTRNFRIFLGRL